MQLSLTINLPIHHLWQLLVDVEAQQQWLGNGAVMSPHEGSRVQLSHNIGNWRSGFVTSVSNESHLELSMLPAAGWIATQRSTKISIQIQDSANSRSRISVFESGLLNISGNPPPQEDAEKFWKDALNRLQELAGSITRRKNKPRQAVVVIHGIGEQEPGETLRKFVTGGLATESRDIQYWSKPDQLSDIFELRKMTLKASDKQSRPTTDVYELYWAHLIRDTTIYHIIDWLRHLLFRRNVPKKYKPLWAGIIAFLVVGFVATGLGLAHTTEMWTKVLFGGSILTFLIAGLWKIFGKSYLINSVGDAVRYLTPRPANIRHRQAIRSAGVDLLDKLHKNGTYDRIVIVGHSLGSVIAYDLISHYWARTFRKHLNLAKVNNVGAIMLERALCGTGVATAQELQNDAWTIARRNGQPWLISDLVTLGSPLSTASFLMSSSEEAFKQAIAQRELPACPPIHEDVGTKRYLSHDRPYIDRFGMADKTFKYLHHAAPFALTRWTNLHFKSGLLADPIGGPVSPQFGSWIKDVALPEPSDKKRFLHTRYWSGPATDEHIKALQSAIKLCSGNQLLGELADHSPLLYLNSSDFRLVGGPPQKAWRLSSPKQHVVTQASGAQSISNA